MSLPEEIPLKEIFPADAASAPRTSPSRGHLLRGVEAIVEPAMIVLTLLLLAIVLQGRVRPIYILLAAIAFAMTFPGRPRLSKPLGVAAIKIAVSWIFIGIALLFLIRVAHYVERFDYTVVLWWIALAPFAAIGGHALLRAFTPALRSWQGAPDRVVVVGMNPAGIELARAILRDPYRNVELAGFSDDRSVDRLGVDASRYTLLGTIDELSRYVKQQSIHTIYVSLPLASQPRIRRMLDDLRDTTASIYFVPDMFVTDLIQGGMTTAAGMPVVAICEVPSTVSVLCATVCVVHCECSGSS